MLQRRPILAALLFVAIIWVIGFILLSIATDPKRIKAAQERETNAAIESILDMGQLAKLPRSAKDVKAEKGSIMFGYQTRLEFNATMADIQQWIGKSQGVAPADNFDEANSGSRKMKYNLALKKPGRGHTGTLELDEATGEVKVEIMIIDSSL